MFPTTFVSAGTEYCTYEKAVAAPLFKKEFEITEISDDAGIIIGSKGLYELWLNGENITDGLLAPFNTNANKSIYYRTYNVKDKLKIGKNSIYVLLGNGFANPIGGEIWDQYKLPNRGAPAFALGFMCADVYFCAKDFVWTRSPLLFDDYRIGTYFDARVIDDIKDGKVEWQEPTIIEEPTGKKRILESEPIREIKRLVPTLLPNEGLREYRIRNEFDGLLHTECDLMFPAPLFGGKTYDFGENGAGVPIVTFRDTTPGQVIHMQFTELLFEGFADYTNVDIYPDGCCQQDIYVCRGAKEETYTPSFTYHGCRYCYLYGIEKEKVTLEFAIVRNDVPKKSDFNCSDEISNKIFKACRRSDESNLHHAVTDCPTREKNGWTGDASISADHFLLGYGAERCFASWLATVADFVSESGSMPCIVPSHGGCSDSVIWDSVLTSIPYYCYKYGGDTKIISDTADAMIRNLKYHLGFRDERGIVDRGMGDWLPVDKGAYGSDSPLGFCCTAMMYDMCRKGAIIFDKIGNTEYAEFCKAAGKELRDAIRAEYCEGGVVTVGRTEKYRKPQYSLSQTSQAIGLYFGIFDKEEEHEAVETLVKLIHESDDSFTCGFLGLRAIFHVLTKYGYSSLAYKMITKPSHPSYANMIYRGETTVWERFIYPGGRTGSHNHHFMAEPSAWYIEDILGIHVNPGLVNKNSILVKPDFIPELSFAEGYYDNGEGRIEVRWERQGDEIMLYVKSRKFDVSVDVPDAIRVVREEL